MRLNSQELLRRAQAKIDAAAKLQSAAEDEDRDNTDDELEQIKAHLADAVALRERAELSRELESQQTYLAGTDGRQTAHDTLSDDGGPPSQPASARDPGERARHGFYDLGEFAAAVYRFGAPGADRQVDQRLLRDDQGEMRAAASGMSQGVGTDGGFLVPPEFSTSVWDGLNDDPLSIYSRTDNYTISGESITFTANAETSRATGSRYGGIRGYWIAEAAQITSSAPKLRQVKLEPQELAVLTYVTDKLLRNGGTALTQFVTRAATSEIAFLVNDSIINGDGVGKPLGILNAACLVTIAAETSQVADTVEAANIMKMWGRVHARSRSNAVWLLNQDVEHYLYRMSSRNVAHTALSDVPVYLPANGLADQPFSTLFGRPVIPCDYCATAGDAGDIILADLSGYATATREAGIRGATSMHLRFDYAETAFRWMWEVDGQPWLQSALTPFKGSNTLSTFVALGARA